VIYDSKSLVEGLASDWGFSCLVGNDLLFNSGRNGSLLLKNMAGLGVKPSALNSVVISNAEVDHSGGLFDLLKQNPLIKIYLHPKFPEGFIKNVREKWGDRLVLVSKFTELSPDIYVTGPYPTREQLLVIRAKAGLVVLTGCGQPNLVDMLENIQKHLAEPIYLVIGGLHLSCRMEAEALKLIDEFQRLGVKRVAPCHCSGQEEGRKLFKDAYGDDCFDVGVGFTVKV
jgi:7,8-dihydropterin-6-yl-methyl-4-(beta-D-ribofuranosyl)aminobenzene 5'-phosphate synthase